MVYSARIESLIKPMFDAFTEKTGIPVNTSRLVRRNYSSACRVKARTHPPMSS